MSDLKKLLCEGAELMDLTLSEHQTNQLLTYQELLGKWNKVYNLSAIRDPIESIKKHLDKSIKHLKKLDIIHFWVSKNGNVEIIK